VKNSSLHSYLDYYDNHPDEFKDEPSIGMCGTIWIKGIEGGRCTASDMDSASKEIRKRWENYHLAKAQDLGFEIDHDLPSKYFPRRGSNFDLF
jgi:hypothetical protein